MTKCLETDLNSLSLTVCKVVYPTHPVKKLPLQRCYLLPFEVTLSFDCFHLPTLNQPIPRDNQRYKVIANILYERVTVNCASSDHLVQLESDRLLHTREFSRFPCQPQESLQSRLDLYRKGCPFGNTIKIHITLAQSTACSSTLIPTTHTIPPQAFPTYTPTHTQMPPTPQMASQGTTHTEGIPNNKWL